MIKRNPISSNAKYKIEFVPEIVEDFLKLYEGSMNGNYLGYTLEAPEIFRGEKGRRAFSRYSNKRMEDKLVGVFRMSWFGYSD